MREGKTIEKRSRASEIEQRVGKKIEKSEGKIDNVDIEKRWQTR